jgi:hypothetical protein
MRFSNTLKLELIKRTDSRLLADMAIHYSKPKGFVGRNICYAILVDETYFGGIVGGSATLHLPGRDEFFLIEKNSKNEKLLQIVNNIFYHIEPRIGRYPFRNFAQKVLALFRETIKRDWEKKYGQPVIGFESLVELPRKGEIYLRDGWTEVGITKGQTCKRIGGKGTDSWTGRRIWDTVNLKPKRVFVRWAKE